VEFAGLRFYVAVRFFVEACSISQYIANNFLHLSDKGIEILVAEEFPKTIWRLKAGGKEAYQAVKQRASSPARAAIRADGLRRSPLPKP